MTEGETYTFMARSVFGFEATDTAFSGPLQAVQVPLFATVSLPSKFRPESLRWFECLDQIWNAYEAAHQARPEVQPALMYRVNAENARGELP